MSMKIYSKHTDALLYSFECWDPTSDASSDIKATCHAQS